MQQGEDTAAITALLEAQSGVVSRRQVLALRGGDHDIKRRLRRREWARMHEGVYVNHTGPPSWDQRAWAAVLLHAPAVLTGRSALVAHGLVDSDDGPVEVAVDHARRVDDPPGVRTSRVRGLAAVSQDHLSPPRVRLDHAVLLVAAGARREDAAVAVLADAVQQRRTTAERLLTALDMHPRLSRRSLLREVLADVASGAFSALERRYLRDVESAHGLPRAERQRRADGARAAYRDAAYPAQRAVVELDGRLGHERTPDVWSDLDRDVDAAVADLLTVRVAWRQVLAPCRLAGSIAAILTARGWSGPVSRCGPGCSLETGEDHGALATAILPGSESG